MLDGAQMTSADYDFAFGFILIIVAFACLIFNTITWLFVAKDPALIIMAASSLGWFLFAPVYISKVTDPWQWTLSKWGTSIWSALLWRRYMKQHPEYFP
jgi:hypothetical protein